MFITVVNETESEKTEGTAIIKLHARLEDAIDVWTGRERERNWATYFLLVAVPAAYCFINWLNLFNLFFLSSVS